MRAIFEVEYGERRGQVRLHAQEEIPMQYTPAPPQEAPIAQTQLCARCRVEEAAPSRKSCPGCLEYDRLKAALRRLEAKEIHGCLVCKAPVKPGTHIWHGKEMRWQHCEEHLAYYRFHTRKG